MNQFNPHSDLRLPPNRGGEGHDFRRLIAERVVINDTVEGQNSVRQPVLPQELPDIFLVVEFEYAWRELQGRDVVWNLKGLGADQPSKIMSLARRDWAAAGHYED
jgi:hypothetical protein